MILASEAVVCVAYQDAAKVWTIGAGITSAAGLGPVYKGLRVTPQKAFEDFGKALGKYEARVSKAVPGALLPHEFDALSSFDYNTGQIAGGSVDDKLRAGNVPAAIATLKQYTKAGGKTLPGLVRRRNEEAELFLTGKYPKIAGIPVYDTYPGKPRLLTLEALRASPAAVTVGPPTVNATPAPPEIAPSPSIPAPSLWRRLLWWFQTD